MDPIYVDTDEDGAEYRQPNKPAWKSTAGLDYQDLLHEAFHVCSHGNKKYFGSPWEQKAWKKICKSLNKGTMSIDWVEHQLAFARTKNKDKLCILFYQFEHMVLNIERQKDWEVKNRIALGSLSDIVEEGTHDFAD